MAYRQSEFGLIVRLDPKLAKRMIREAFSQVPDGPGRTVEKAAEVLGIGATSLKRAMRQLHVRHPNSVARSA